LTGNLVVAVVGIIAALVLAFREMRSQHEPPRRLLMMAGIWIVIIIGLVFVIRSAGLHTS
jgi:multisubunit Na+/H+ antiporter MnhB subunit